MGTARAYRPDVDDVTGSTVYIVKAAHGGAAGRPAYMSLTRVSVTSLPATQKRPQVDNLHRHWRLASAVVTSVTGYQMIARQHLLLNTNQKQ